MGIVTGLDLIHNKITSQSFKTESGERAPFLNKLKATSFKVKELYPLLKPFFDKNKKFKLTQISQNTIEIEEVVEEDYLLKYNTYTIFTNNEKDVCIESDYLTPLLYKLLAYFSLENHEVNIACNGDTYLFFTPETISNYKNGSYHYISKIRTIDLYGCSQKIMNDFRGYNDYWKFTLFDENFKIEINNHSSEIYEDDEEIAPENEFYCIDITDSKQSLNSIEKAKELNNGNYYFAKLTYDKVLNLIQDLIQDLIIEDKKHFLTAFTPQCSLNSNLSAVIKNTNIKDVIEFIEKRNAYYSDADNTIQTKKEHTKNNFSIDISYKRKLSGQSIRINDDDLLSGDLYFDKFYNENIFEIVTKTIAQNFCPCYISCAEMLEYTGFVIYYNNEHDKKLIENYFKKLKNIEDYGLHFKKV